jgi:hypothetical protein
MDLALDAETGILFVADTGNSVIRAIAPTAGADVYAVVGTPGLVGTLPGPLAATLFNPLGVAVNPVSRNLVITVPDAVLQTQ